MPPAIPSKLMTSPTAKNATAAPSVPPPVSSAKAAASMSLPAGERTVSPLPKTMAHARRAASHLNPIGVARRHHNVAWAFAILGALVASVLFSIHVYVMPLPVAAVYFRPAFIDVTSQPAGADVYVDGKKVLGTTPAIVEIQRDHLDHVIELHKDGFEPVRRSMRYDREVRLSAAVHLAPASKPVR